MRHVHWMTIGALALSLSLGGDARADASGLGTWEGTGVVVDLEGAELGEFSITLVKRAAGARTVETRGEVTLGDGQSFSFRQRSVTRGNRFRLQTDRGKGDGICVGGGLCQSYEDVGGGKGFATTIIFDSPERMRVLVTELDQGAAVRYYRQTLTRKE